MPTLLRLPVELLAEITKLVHQPINLTGVCRMLKDVATPVAYRSLTLPLFYRQVGRYPEPGTIARTLGRLLRTMIAQPSLGMLVQRVEISFTDVPLPRERYYKKAAKISEDIRILAVQAASSHELSESVRAQLAEGLLGAALFLLLCHFPNLDSLDLIPECGGNFFNLIVTSRILPCGLRSLRSVYVHQPEIWNCVGHDDIFALFCLPSLQRIRCDILEPADDATSTSDEMVLFGGTSQIEDVNILGRDVDVWILTAMIRSVQRLRSFRCKADAGSWLPFAGALLGEALHAHAHTLEDLEVQVVEIDYPPNTMIGSLRQYTKLTRLAISLPILLGNPSLYLITELQPRCRIGELLPESLISFDVCIDEDWLHIACGHLTRFIEVDLKYVPNLKQLSVGVRSDEFCNSDLDTTMLRAACVASGITFTISDLPY